MSRIAQKFKELRRDSQRGFIPFITAGDPDLETSLAIMNALASCGADVIELGVPFSDPMADGPTIQRSSQRSLENGVTLAEVIALAKRFRDSSDVPIVLFTYFNPVLAMGLDTFCDSSANAGIDGVLLTDVIEDEAAAIAASLAKRNIDLIRLIAPTTTNERLEQICTQASGFVYAVARAGVTGARDTMTNDAEQLVARAREFTDLPIAVGFGISNAEHVADVWRFADGAVVGSAIVSEIEKAETPNDAVERVEAFVSGLIPEFANKGRNT